MHSDGIGPSVLLQSLLERANGWPLVAASVFGPGVVAAVWCAPFLASVRIRALFRRLPPFESTLATYALVVVLGSLPYVLGVVAAITGVDTEGLRAGARMGEAILGVVVPLSVVYAVGVPPVGALGLPRAGIDWNPTGYGVSTWLLLAAGGVWYAALFAVPLALVSVILAFPE